MHIVKPSTSIHPQVMYSTTVANRKLHHSSQPQK